MPDVIMGQRLKELVRRYFEKGRKSSNKLYASNLAGDVPDTNRARKRETDRSEAEDTRRYTKTLPATGLDDFAANVLLNLGKHDIPIEELAGNCGEMAILASHLAWRFEHIAQQNIYHGSIGKPGDHAFCLISDAPIPAAARSATTLYGFLKLNPNHLIIDPWLNTACLSGFYIRQTKQRLLKWQASGKRISWDGANGKSPGWHAPAGDYKDAMQRSPLTLHPFS